MIEEFEKLKPMHQTIIAGLAFIAMVSVWRGMWGLLELYVFPGNPGLSYWTVFIGGVIVLALTGYTAKEIM